MTVCEIPLEKGIHRIKIELISGYAYFELFKLEKLGSLSLQTGVTDGPYKNHYLPGLIQAEDFDVGENNYYSSSAVNAGAVYRKNEPMDIYRDAGSYYIALAKNEFTTYTVIAEFDGYYDIYPEFYEAGKVKIYVDDYTNYLTAEATSNNESVYCATIYLGKGKHKIKLASYDDESAKIDSILIISAADKEKAIRLNSDELDLSRAVKVENWQQNDDGIVSINDNTVNIYGMVFGGEPAAISKSKYLYSGTRISNNQICFSRINFPQLAESYETSIVAGNTKYRITDYEYAGESVVITTADNIFGVNESTKECYFENNSALVDECGEYCYEQGTILYLPRNEEELENAYIITDCEWDKDGGNIPGKHYQPTDRWVYANEFDEYYKPDNKNLTISSGGEIGFTVVGEWYEYDVPIYVSGNYKLYIRGGNGDMEKQAFAKIRLDNKDVAEIEVPNFEENEWTAGDIYVGEFSLANGLHRLRLEHSNSNWLVGGYRVVPAGAQDESSYNEAAFDDGVLPKDIVTIERKPAFLDVGNHWSESVVTELNRLGIIYGVSETEFAPDKNITAHEAKALALRACRLDETANEEENHSISREKFCDIIMKVYFSKKGEYDVKIDYQAYTDINNINEDCIVSVMGAKRWELCLAIRMERLPLEIRLRERRRQAQYTGYISLRPIKRRYKYGK